MDHLNTKIVAIHQPNYFPWAGYFYKMFCSDEFVFLDKVKLNKQSYTRRTLLPTDEPKANKTWLTVPLLKHSDMQTIHSLQVDFQQDWQAYHLARIKQYYRTFPYFHEMIALVKHCFDEIETETLLSEINIKIIKIIATKLSITPQYHNASELELLGSKNELNIEILQKLNAGIYMCGEGSKNTYLDESLFVKNNIKIQFTHYNKLAKLSAYRNHPNAGTTSIIDAIAYLGTQGVQDYFNTLKQIEKPNT